MKKDKFDLNKHGIFAPPTERNTSLATRSSKSGAANRTSVNNVLLKEPNPYLMTPVRKSKGGRIDKNRGSMGCILQMGRSSQADPYQVAQPRKMLKSPSKLQNTLDMKRTLTHNESPKTANYGKKPQVKSKYIMQSAVEMKRLQALKDETPSKQQIFAAKRLSSDIFAIKSAVQQSKRPMSTPAKQGRSNISNSLKMSLDHPDIKAADITFPSTMKKQVAMKISGQCSTEVSRSTLNRVLSSKNEQVRNKNLDMQSQIF